jgi:hypothetical protein
MQGAAVLTVPASDIGILYYAFDLFAQIKDKSFTFFSQNTQKFISCFFRKTL